MVRVLASDGALCAAASQTICVEGATFAPHADTNSGVSNAFTDQEIWIAESAYVDEGMKVTDRGVVLMNRALIVSLFAVSAAWALYLQRGTASQRRSASQRLVPAAEAAEKLRQAWAKNHTIA